jgi:hypothetical protein
MNNNKQTFKALNNKEQVKQNNVPVKTPENKEAPQNKFNPAMVAGNYFIQTVAPNGTVLKTYVVNNARVVIGPMGEQSTISELRP